jgi:tetratricopeptide (TPR) repeat protein/transcriptional regulator with XRE-family HTH domain
MARDDRPAFGALLQRFRYAAGLSQEELADHSSLSLSAVSALERGARRSPYRHTIAQLAEALDLSPQEQALLEAAAKRQPRQNQATPASAEASADASSETTSAPGVYRGRHVLTKASAVPALVGRTQELAWLHHEIATGRPLLLFSGEPGIGKSRLLRESLGWARKQGWRVLSGGCRQSSGQEPYAPLVEALVRSVGALPPERTRRSLEGCAWLTRLLPELADARYGLTNPAGLPSAQERRLMFAAVDRYLSNISGRAGTLLLLDDLQWTGSDALDLLAHLIRSTRNRRLRILGAFRSTEAPTGSALSSLIADLARDDMVSQRELAPLKPEDALALASDALGGEESALAARVVERGGGVPFYLVSFARSMQPLGEGHDHHESGGSSASEARARLPEPPRSPSMRKEEVSWEVPWNVKQSIRERVAALPLSAQDLLGVAAVVGQRASGAVLAAGAEQSERETVTSIEIACQAGLLVEDEERDRQDRYHFAHDLIRDVVEAGLSSVRQTLLHRRVAVALEQRLRRSGAAGRVNDRMLAQVAYHCARADMPDQEASYLRQAGDHARHVYAHREAAQYYQQLIACLDRLEKRREGAQARKDLAVEFARVGFYREAVAPLEQAEEICRESGDAETLAQVTMVSGQLHAALGTSEEGLARVHPLVAEYAQEGGIGSAASSTLSATVMAQLLGALSGLSFMAGHYQDALQAAERAVTLAQATGDARLFARQRLNLGVALFTVGRLTDATMELEDTIESAEGAKDLETLAEALRMASWVYQTRGMFVESQRAQTRGLNVAQQLGDVVGLGHALFLDALLAFYQGEWDIARDIAKNSLAVFGALGLTHLSAYPPLGLGWLSIIEGDQDAGEPYLTEAERIANQSGPAQVLRFVTALRAECELLAGQAEEANKRLTPWFAGEPMQERTRLELNVLRAWGAVELGKVAEADTWVDDTVSSARASDMRLVLPDALRVQGLWAMRREKWDEAEKALDEAITLSRGLPYPYAEAKALYVSGQMWAARSEPPRAKALFAEALAICQRLGERLYGDAIAQALSAHGGRAR